MNQKFQIVQNSLNNIKNNKETNSFILNNKNVNKILSLRNKKIKKRNIRNYNNELLDRELNYEKNYMYKESDFYDDGKNEINNNEKIMADIKISQLKSCKYTDKVLHFWLYCLNYKYLNNKKDNELNFLNEEKVQFLFDIFSDITPYKPNSNFSLNFIHVLKYNSIIALINIDEKSVKYSDIFYSRVKDIIDFSSFLSEILKNNKKNNNISDFNNEKNEVSSEINIMDYIEEDDNNTNNGCNNSNINNTNNKINYNENYENNEFLPYIILYKHIIWLLSNLINSKSNLKKFNEALPNFQILTLIDSYFSLYIPIIFRQTIWLLHNFFISDQSSNTLFFQTKSLLIYLENAFFYGIESKDIELINDTLSLIKLYFRDELVCKEILEKRQKLVKYLISFFSLNYQAQSCIIKLAFRDDENFLVKQYNLIKILGISNIKNGFLDKSNEDIKHYFKLFSFLILRNSNIFIEEFIMDKEYNFCDKVKKYMEFNNSSHFNLLSAEQIFKFLTSIFVVSSSLQKAEILKNNMLFFCFQLLQNQLSTFEMESENEDFRRMLYAICNFIYKMIYFILDDTKYSSYMIEADTYFDIIDLIQRYSTTKYGGLEEILYKISELYNLFNEYTNPE